MDGNNTDRSGVYIGIDISSKYSLISYYQLNMDEPETISTIVGSEAYQIPTYIAKRNGVGQWFIGNDARRQVQMNYATGVDHLYDAAIDDRMIMLDAQEFSGRELLLIFLRNLMALPGRMYQSAPLKKLTICVPELSLSVVELFVMLSGKLGLSANQIALIDHRESFYYYALSQAPELFMHDVLLFDYTTSSLTSCVMKRNTYTKPQVVTLEQRSHGSLIENRDVEFDRIAEEVMEGEFISSVYLIGDGFDDDWMKVSLARLCRGRRVFMGKNLYSKGACYAGAIKDGTRDWPFIYIGDNELKMNLALKVSDRNEMKFINLLNAGENWYETGGECEVILDGTPEIEVWVQRLDSRQTRIEVLELRDLPYRENRTTRLRIIAKAQSDRQALIEIKDLGFGEFVPTTGKVWKHTIGIA